MVRCLMYVKCVALVVGLLIAAVSPVAADWEFQESGVDENMYDICFIDEYHGWAVGENSTIIRTTTGGEIWELTDYPEEGWTFECVEFYNTQTGYLLGHDWNSENPSYVYKVFVTLDGGMSWDDITPVNEEYDDFHDLAVIDENTCYVTASVNDGGNGRGRILFTMDGGKSWHIQITDQHSFPQEFHGIDFIDNKTGWALNALYQDMYGDTFLYKTENGSDWTEISMVSKLNQHKIHALNGDVLWAGNVLLHASKDGGQTWSLQNKRYNDLIRDVYPLDELNAYVLMTDSLMHTDNGGISFETVFAYSSDTRSLFSAISGIDGKFLWCLRFSGEIIRYSLDETIIEKTQSFPEMLKIKNSPNPFNVSTLISFDCDVESNIDLSIYDVLGRKIETLYSGDTMPGSYSFKWNGGDCMTSGQISSGVYFAVLKTTKDISTQKMLLLR